MMKKCWCCIYIPSLLYSSLLRSIKTQSLDSITSQNQCSFVIQQFSSFLIDSLLYLFQSNLLHEPLLQSVLSSSFSLLFDICNKYSINIGVNLSSLFTHSLPLLQNSMLVLFIVKCYCHHTVITDLLTFTVGFSNTSHIVNSTFHCTMVETPVRKGVCHDGSNVKDHQRYSVFNEIRSDIR